MSEPTDFSLSCPIPITDYPNVLMAHGGGGRLSRNLIERMFGRAFANPALDARHDGAELTIGGQRLAMTTDSYVVRPLFFPGGDIGTLAINGTVNDLSMCGARPLYLSTGFIIEEGLPMETLWQVVESMRRAAEAAGVQIVTGDTKVVDRGKGDGLYVNTAGVGAIRDGVHVSPTEIRPGDAVILSGDIGRHGMAIMAVREGLEFETTIESDCAPLNGAVAALLDSGVAVHCLRDATRGGLAASLTELADAAGVEIRFRQADVPVREDVSAACEILGFDPLYVANEGRMVCFVPEADADRAVDVLRAQPVTEGATRIGTVIDGEAGIVRMTTVIGVDRIVDLLSGEQLPRIC